MALPSEANPLLLNPQEARSRSLPTIKAAESPLLTLPEAAGLLGLKLSTLRAWVLHRRCPYVKVGRLVRFRRADVEALIAKGYVPAQEVQR